MELKILDQKYDEVIRSVFLTVRTNYGYAIEKLVPLIDKLEFQRNQLRASFYKRLESDIIKGCIMPPLTVAIKMPYSHTNSKNISETQLNEYLKKAFILDGIQRLSTLKRIENNPAIDKNRALYLNVLLCDSMDRLLYRMITLNNGQKPMTARHQIEILAGNIFDFDSLPILSISEKQAKSKRYKNKDEYMNKDVLIKGYLAFISNSINIDNQKIIESKMDELIAEQIMESDFTERNIEFKDAIEYIDSLLISERLKEWFSIANNFIGFSAAVSKSYYLLKKEPAENIEAAIVIFEKAFEAIDVSKIKLGLVRRRMVKFFFENYSEFSSISENKLIDIISQEI